MKIDKRTEDKWEPTNNRFVAYIDIMGFKEMVLRRKHEDIYKMMKTISEKKDFNASIDWGDSNSNLIRTTTYSDSIMIYSKDESYKSLYSLICTVSSFSNDLFLAGIPHKGAIAHGLMTLDTENSIYFGQPLIDAYLLQEELNYYGIISHATAEEKIINYVKPGQLIPFIKNCTCYLKGGNTKHFTIYPIHADPFLRNLQENNKQTQTFTKAIESLRFMTSGHLRRYIDFTETYFQDLEKAK